MAHYKELFDHAMRLWSEYGESYRTILDRYNKLLDNKEIKVKRISASDLKEYPKIDFLDITDEEAAEEYLLCLDERYKHELSSIIAQVTTFKSSYIYTRLVSTVKYYDNKIKRGKIDKQKYACYMDPDACGCGRKCTNHTRSSYRCDV